MNKSKYVAHSRGMSCPVRVVNTNYPTKNGNGRPQKQPMITLEVGKVFKSIAQAEMFTGISQQHILAQLEGRIPHARGVVFERVVLDQETTCCSCGKAFTKKSDRHRACSEKCRNRYHKALARERYKAKTEREKGR